MQVQHSIRGAQAVQYQALLFEANNRSRGMKLRDWLIRFREVSEEDVLARWDRRQMGGGREGSVVAANRKVVAVVR